MNDNQLRKKIALTHCMDNIPAGFDPLDIELEHDFRNHSCASDAATLISLANLYNDKEALSRLIQYAKKIDESPLTQGSVSDKESNSLLCDLKSIVPHDAVNLFFMCFVNSISDSDSEKGIERIPLADEITFLCARAHQFVSLYSNPEKVMPSGFTALEGLQSIIATTLSAHITDIQYSPIIGICNGEFMVVDAFNVENGFDYLVVSWLSVLRSKVIIKKCENCGKYFTPASRSDEIYCSNRLPNGKTCKDVGYTEKIKRDEVLCEYRKIYKTQNMRKNRNRHIPDIEKKFRNWAYFAKSKCTDCQNGDITLDQMKSAISSPDWMKDSSNMEK